MSDFFPRIWALGDIQPGPKFTLLAIARFSASRGFCWANVRTISQATGYKERATRDHINALEEAGLIKRRARKRTNGGQASNVIWLTLPEHVEPEMTPPDRPHRFADFEMIDELSEEFGEPAKSARGSGDKRSPPPASDDEGRPADSAGYIEVQDSSGKKEEESMSDSGESDALGSDSKDAVEEEKEDPVHVRVAESIWAMASARARQRSHKGKLVDAVKGHLGKKLSPEDLISAWRAYVQSPDGSKEQGAFQKGPDRWIRARLYETFLEEIRSEAGSGESLLASRDLGTHENPTPLGMRVWMTGWVKRGSWRSGWGPEPGAEGCRISPEILREFGIVPHEERGR